MKRLSLKQRALLGLLVGVLSCIAQLAYYKYRARFSPWARVPRHKWEQMAAQIRHGVDKPLPLDSATIMTDLQDWLQLSRP